MTDTAPGAVRGLMLAMADEITASNRNMRRMSPLRFGLGSALERFQKFAECYLAIEKAVSDFAHSSARSALGHQDPTLARVDHRLPWLAHEITVAHGWFFTGRGRRTGLQAYS